MYIIQHRTLRPAVRDGLRRISRTLRALGHENVMAMRRASASEPGWISFVGRSYAGRVYFHDAAENEALGLVMKNFRYRED